jgi:hypothetical protein
VNAALAFIAGAHPQDKIEAALVIQMVCTHAAVMSVFARFAADRRGLPLAIAFARV